MVWSVILCSRSAPRESQSNLCAAGRRAGEGWRGAERAEGRGLEMERAEREGGETHST